MYTGSVKRHVNGKQNQVGPNGRRHALQSYNVPNIPVLCIGPCYTGPGNANAAEDNLVNCYDMHPI